MGNETTRRRWMYMCAANSLIALTGCLGGGDTPVEGEENTTSRSTDSQDVTQSSDSTSYAYEQFRKSGTRGIESTEISSKSIGFVTADGHGYQKLRHDEQGTIDESEMYVIDNTGYIVRGQDCQEATLATPDPLGDVYTNYLTAAIDRGASETTLLDGIEVEVYRTTHEDTPLGSDGNSDWTATQYVAIETGFLLKHEEEMYNTTNESESEATTEFHSFGDAFTVEPPTHC